MARETVDFPINSMVIFHCKLLVFAFEDAPFHNAWHPAYENAWQNRAMATHKMIRRVLGHLYGI